MKAKFGIIISFLLVLNACQTSNQSDNNAENEKIIQEYYSHFNSHNWQKMAEMYTDSALFKDPSFGKGIVSQTQKQIFEKYSGLNETFADIHDKIENIYFSDKNHVIVEFVSTGTAPDSSKFELPICTIFTIENGKIKSDFTYYDNFEEQK